MTSDRRRIWRASPRKEEGKKRVSKKNEIVQLPPSRHIRLWCWPMVERSIQRPLFRVCDHDSIHPHFSCWKQHGRSNSRCPVESTESTHIATSDAKKKSRLIDIKVDNTTSNIQIRMMIGYPIPGKNMKGSLVCMPFRKHCWAADAL